MWKRILLAFRYCVGVVELVGACCELTESAWADEYVSKACISEQTGAARFVDALPERKSQCKKKEYPIYSKNLSRVYDGNGIFIGYIESRSNFDPYKSEIFVPDIGANLYVSPDVDGVGNVENVNVGVAIPYRTRQKLYFAFQGCGPGHVNPVYYAWGEYQSYYRDPLTRLPYKLEGEPGVIAPKSMREFTWDWVGGNWVDGGCIPVEASQSELYFKPNSIKINLPFGFLALPMVLK